MRGGWKPWLSTMATNLAIALVSVVMIRTVCLRPFLLVHLPVTLIGASLGVWLFYVQHQFEQTYWARGRDWSLHDVALYGSSLYDLPRALRWFTANIGLHHIHHLCSRIPFYRLPLALRQHPDLADVSRLTLGQSFVCIRRVLWDEASGRLIAFRELVNRHIAGSPESARPEIHAL
jgi:acyl-lipid omega-6 desaturase (Delta-12 desaturase)